MKKIIRLTENDLTKLVNKIILESVKNDVHNQLIEIAKNVDSYEEFEKIVIYYGYTKLENIDVDLLINTEKVSGLPIVSDSPISVGQDIKTNKYYIIDGHNRVKRAKEKGLKSINAYVVRGKITRRGGFSLEPETSIFVEENNINLKEFYKKIKRLTENDLTKLVKRVIKEQDENEEYLEKLKILIDNEQFETALQLGETLDLEDKVLDLILDKIVKEGDFKWWAKKIHSAMKEKKYFRIDSAIDDIVYEFIQKDYYANMLYNIINNMTDQNKADEFYFKMNKLIYSEIEKQVKKLNDENPHI